MALELRPDMNIPAIITTLAIQLQGDFCWSRSFDATFLSRLMYEGFLVMCDKHGKVRWPCCELNTMAMMKNDYL